MKTKISRISRRSLAVFLGILMLVLSLGLGSLITFNAVNASDWVLVGNINNSNNWDINNGVVMEAVSGGYSATVTLTNSKDFRIRHNNQDYGNNEKNVKIGSYTLAQTGSTFVWKGSTGEYTVTINSAGTEITFSGEGGDTPAQNTYYYSGDATSWSQTAMTVSDDGNYEYFEVSGSNIFKIGTESSQYAYGGQSDHLHSGYNNTDVALTDDGDYHNIKSSQAGTHYIIVYRNDVAGAGYDDPIICASTTLPSTSALPKVTDSDLIAVLKGTKIMFYGGELTTWDQHEFKLDNNITGTSVGNTTITNTYEFRKFCVARTSYVMGHWNSGMSTTPDAGKAYVVRGSTSASTHTQKANSGSNYIYEISNGETLTVDTTCDGSITEGSKLSVSSGSAGNSVLGLTNSIEYYVYDGTNYYSAEVSDGKIDTSELAIKNGYSLITVLKDTNGLRVVADTDTFNVISPVTALTTPTITIGGESTTRSTNAEYNVNDTLVVTNDATVRSATGFVKYEIYKNGSGTGTYFTGSSYNIPKSYASNANYTVVAIGDTTHNSNSSASNQVAVTYSKVALNRPTISVTPTSANYTDTITLTVGNYAALSTYCDISTNNFNSANVNNSGVATTTYSSQSATTASATHDVSVTATIKSAYTNYYSLANASSTSTTVTTHRAVYSLLGQLQNINGSSASENWSNYNSNFAISTTSSTPGVYTYSFTTKSDTNAYLGFKQNGGSRYSISGYTQEGADYTVPSTSDGTTALTMVTASNGSLIFKKNKTYTVKIDQPNKKLYISCGSYSVEAAARYSTFNLASDTHNAIVSGETGGTVTVSPSEVNKGNTARLTASAASGYTFQGFYSNEACTNRITTATPYDVTPDDDKTYYAYFKQNTPAHYNVTVASAANITVTATYNGTTINEGSGTLSVPVGASVTVNYTLNTGCRLDSITPSVASSGGTFTMTASNTTVTAVASKINYNLTKNETSNGSFKLTNASGTEISTAQYGDTVKVVPTANTGYQVNTVKRGTTFSVNTNITKTDGVYSFSMPANNQYVGVSFSAIDYNITASCSPAAGGTVTVSKTNNGASTSTYNIGNTLYIRTTTNEAYTFDNIVVTFSDSTTQTINATSGSVSMANKTGAISVVANFTAKPTYAVTAVTNNATYGTVSASPATAYSGQTISVTTAEKSGTLDNVKILKTSDNSDVTTTVSYDSSNKEFTMPAYAVTVKATFKTYVADSGFYYNGYNSSGGALSGYHDMQMTEGMIDGKKFSYYHVEGRTGDDQLFTVSLGHPSQGTRYVYFTRPKGWDTWSGTNNPKAHFWNSTTSQTTWPGTEMSWQWNNDMGEGVYKVAIPTGATSVKFNDASDTAYRTVAIDLTTTSGAYYLSGGGSGTDADGYHVSEWNTGWADQGWVNQGTEYFYSNTIYQDHWFTGGFYSHNTNNHDYIKPKTGNSKDFSQCKGDYYIVVLYPNTTYTFNSNTEATGSELKVLWMSELPIEEGTKVYAKDGAIRSESFGSTYANIADTQIVASASSTESIGTHKDGNISGQTYETYNASPGETIYIRTTINTTAGNGADTTTNRDKYYVRGFMINGEVSELLTWDSSGVYTTSYKIPEDYEEKYIEITPIYYLKDTTEHPVVTFRVTDFPKNKYNWGDTIYAYPFYGKLGSNNNALGAYPGQPLVFYKGQYQIQIPQKSTAWDVYLSDSALSGTDAQKKTQVADTNVSGITMSNGYYDLVHRTVMGYGSNGASADHVQTYDYGDFYKIFNEKSPVDNIVYDFKYETSKDNRETLGDTTSYTKSTIESTYGTGGNGFELLENFHGRHVDLFGTPLSGDAADPSKTTPVYVVSIAGPNGSNGVENVAGYYATEWAVFTSSNGTSYSRMSAGDKSSIPPEILVLNDDDATSFNNSTYPSAVSGNNVTDWEALYTALEAYRGKPVYISYESAQLQIGQNNFAKTGGGGATRNDGRWLYSKNGESITANIRIDVSTDNGNTYHENPDAGQSGHVDNLEAYFTNSGVEGETTYSTTVDPDKTFDFSAKTTNASYKFVGWYFDDENKTLISTDNDSHTERSQSCTLIARFMQVTSGQLVLSHQVDKTNASYQGDGTTTIAVRVVNGDGETVRTFDETPSAVTLDNKIIKSDNTAYTVYVTLKTVPTGDDTFHETTCSAADTFMGGASSLNSATPAEFSFNVGDLFTGTTQNLMSITYKTNLNKATYSYSFTYSYRGREGSNNQSYTRSGTLTASQVKDYVESEGETRRISQAFINTTAPYESNFNQSFKWDVTEAKRTFTKDGSNYSITETFTATVDTTSEGVKSAARTATFKLPYAYNTYGRPSNLNQMNKSTEADFVVNVNYGELIKKPYPDNEIKTYYENNPNDMERFTYYVTAPKYLYDAEKEERLAFQYWKIFKAGTDIENENNIIAKCYFESFNYIAYDSYTIVPYFEGETKTGYGADTTTASINYLDTSRNQWNNGGNGGKIINNATADNASDILYSDFQLAYSLEDGTAVKTSGDNVRPGLVIQQVCELSLAQDGNYDTNLATYADYLSVDLATSTAFANCAGNQSNDSTNHIKYYNITKGNLDNKDMMDYCYRQYNSIGDGATQYNNRKYLYRAFAYIVVDGNVTLSDKPVLFTIDQEARK